MPPPKRSLTPIEQARADRQLFWEEPFAQVHSLLKQGLGKYEIAKQLNISERVVRKYSHMDYLPKKQSPKSGPKLIDPYHDRLRDFLIANSKTTLVGLHRYLQSLGFKGSRATVYTARLQLCQELQLPTTEKARNEPRDTSSISNLGIESCFAHSSFPSYSGYPQSPPKFGHEHWLSTRFYDVHPPAKTSTS